MPSLPAPTDCANPPDLSGALEPAIIVALAGHSPETLWARLEALDSAGQRVARAAAEEYIAELAAATDTGRTFHRRLKLDLWLALGQLSTDETATRKALDAGR